MTATKEGTSLSIRLRVGNPEDAKECGDICYRAFRVIAEKHNFPPDFASSEVVATLLSESLAHPAIYGVVAELDGRIVGSNFVDERSIIAGIGPITVDPDVQNRAIGRELMQHVMDRVANRRLHRSSRKCRRFEPLQSYLYGSTWT